MRPLKILSLAAMLTFSSAGMADDLSDAEINKWINATTALQTWGKQHEKNDVMPAGQEVAAMKDPGHVFSASIEQAKKGPLFSQMQEVLKQNGYSDADQWAQIGDRIVAAKTANALGNTKGVDPKAMGAAMQQMQNNPNVPPQMRAQFEQMMKGSQAMMQTAQESPPEDKAAVQRNAKVLDAFFNQGHANY